MEYPLISEYREAILSAEDNLNELSSLRPVLDDYGNPVMSSGNFAVVFKMRDENDGKLYAVKCFIKDQDGRDEAYERIASYLHEKSSKYLVSISYYKYDLFVDTTQSNNSEYPIVVMDWVEGLTLDKYIEKYKGNPFVLYELCYNFREMAKWLKSQSFAHGDLKPDNIIIKEDGSITLIDYDGMFIPGMENETARENGTPDYRHPFKDDCFDCNIDDFALAVISLSLKLISVSYGIQDQFAKGTGLLFSYKDFINIDESPLFSQVKNLLTTEPQLVDYYTTFIKCLYKKRISSSDFDFNGECPLESLLNYWGNGVVSNSDRLERGLLSSNGLIYSKDCTFVIGFDENHEYNGEEIYIEEGTIGICEDAFDYRTPKLNLHLPSTLRYFNRESLNYRYLNIHWVSPWFVYTGGCILTKDKSECILIHLKDYSLDDQISIIGAYLFKELSFNGVWPKNIKRIRKYAFFSSSVPDILILPEGILTIEQSAFQYSSVTEVYFPSTLIELGELSFNRCDHLQKISFNELCKIKELNNSTFSLNKQLNDIRFSDALEKIGYSAFQWCDNIETITFPSSLIEIDAYAFAVSNGAKSKLRSIKFNESLKIIGEGAFSRCCALESVSLISDIEVIEKDAFAYCSSIKDFSYKKIRILRTGALCIHNSQTTNYDSEYNDIKGIKLLDFYISEGIGELEVGAITGCNIVGVNNANYIFDGESLYSENYKNLIYYCGKGKDLVIHDGVRDIDSSAFLYKPSSICLPNTFDEANISHACFVRSLIVPHWFSTISPKIGTLITHEHVFIDELGVIYSNDKKILKNFPCHLPIEEYTVINSCIRIENNAFEGEEDYDPEFGSCYYGNKLKELILPESLQSIGEFAMEGCREIVTLKIPNNVRVISNCAFKGCHSLKRITLPKSLIELGKDVFPFSLESMSCPSLNFQSYGGCLLSLNKEILWIPYHIRRLALPSTVIYKGIECYTYPHCIVSVEGKLVWTVRDIPTFTFPNNVKIIGEGAFIHNKIISKLRIPEGITTIENGAFSYNQSLTDVYLPNSIKSIGSLLTYQGWGRKYIEYFYPQRIHIPKGTKSKFLKLLPGIIKYRIIEDYNY